MTTVTALFDTRGQALAAADRLAAIGVARDDISLVASNADGWYENENHVAEGAATGAGAGAALGGAGGLLAGLGLMAIPGIGPVVAAGWLAATGAGALAGAAAGGAAGGVVGALIGEGVPERDANVYAEGVRRGGTILSARVDDTRAVEAQTILDQAAAVDLAGREALYRKEGWTQFDPEARPYADTTPDQSRAPGA